MKAVVLLLAAAAEGVRREGVRSSRRQPHDASLVSVDNTLTQVLLPEGVYEGGRCMDGSQAGYYYGPPPSGSSSLWVISIQGGGGCTDQASCDRWATATSGDHGGVRGSNTGWSATRNGDGELSSNPGGNPNFYDAHHVHVPYCTGDTHSGQVTNATQDSFGYYIDGHLNIRAIAQHLISTIPGISQLERVLLIGTSAGGKGVFHNCDWLQTYLTSQGLSAAVNCVSKAGWFLPGFTEDQPDSDFPPTAWPYWSAGVIDPQLEPSLKALQSAMQMYLPAPCVAAMGSEAWKCGTTHVMYPRIQRPMFVIQDIFDYNPIREQLLMPKSKEGTQQGHDFIAYFGRSMMRSTNQVVDHPLGKTGDGLFLTSCYNHGSGNIRVDGVRRDTAMGDWFYGRGASPKLFVDDCSNATAPGLPCNTECGSVPALDNPNPNPDACEETLNDLCELEGLKAWQCGQCAQGFEAELEDAGCTQSAVTALCMQLR